MLVFVSEVLETVHGVHPGPLNDTKMLAVLNPDPERVKLNDCPAITVVGDVVMLVSCGAVPPALATLIDRLFEAVPVAPFCAVTVNVPVDVIVILPVSWVEDFPVSEPFVTVHGVQPGPLNET